MKTEALIRVLPQKRVSMEKFLNRQSTDKDDYYYVGITGRNWLQRLSEHMREVRNGGRRRFYRAWKASLESPIGDP